MAMSGDLENAERKYERLYLENPTDESLLKNFIFVLLAQDKIDKAEEYLAILKEQFPDSSAIEQIEEKIKPPSDEES